MTAQPQAARAAFPPEYGERGGEADALLPWDHAETRLHAAPNYWITTVSPSGAPHARPVDGAWVNGALCFGGADVTRWARNLARNAAVSVHLPSGDDVVILEGRAQRVEDERDPLVPRFAEAFRAKYPQYFGGDTPPPPLVPFWCLRPRVVFAWTLQGFPNRATRWTF